MNAPIFAAKTDSNRSPRIASINVRKYCPCSVSIFSGSSAAAHASIRSIVRNPAFTPSTISLSEYAASSAQSMI